jgi:hypothetical protein
MAKYVKIPDSIKYILRKLLRYLKAVSTIDATCILVLLTTETLSFIKHPILKFRLQTFFILLF